MNPKLLERQIRLLDARLQKLQDEMNELSRLRDACELLRLSASATAAPARGVSTEKAPRARASKKATGPAPDKPAPVSSRSPSSPPGPPSPKRAPKEELPRRIRLLLQERGSAMTADEIYDALRTQGILRGRHPVASVYATLEKHPELFAATESGQWRPSPPT